MLKPFYIKKKNIDNRLLPAVTAADAGKALVVDANGKIVTGEAGGNINYNKEIRLTASGIGANVSISSMKIDNTVVNIDDYCSEQFGNLWNTSRVFLKVSSSDYLLLGLFSVGEGAIQFDGLTIETNPDGIYLKSAAIGYYSSAPDEVDIDISDFD